VRSHRGEKNGEKAAGPSPRFDQNPWIFELSATSAAASAFASAGGYLKAGGKLETHWRKVNLDGLGLFHELLVHEIGEAVYVQHVIVCLRLIQSQRQ